METGLIQIIDWFIQSSNNEIRPRLHVAAVR